MFIQIYFQLKRYTESAISRIFGTMQWLWFKNVYTVLNNVRVKIPGKNRCIRIRIVSFVKYFEQKIINVVKRAFWIGSIELFKHDISLLSRMCSLVPTHKNRIELPLHPFAAELWLRMWSTRRALLCFRHFIETVEINKPVTE